MSVDELRNLIENKILYDIIQYCELNDKEKHIVRILENGKIQDVCTFERKKVYTLANPCK